MQPLTQANIYALLLAQLLAMLGHLVHAPVWLFGLWGACALWRLQVARQRAGFVNRFGKLGLIGLAVLGVYLSRGSLLGLEAATVLLIAAFALKMLEARTLRDAQVIVLLGFFVVLTFYLFESALWLALYSLLPVSALLAAWLGLYCAQQAGQPKRALKTATLLLVQAAPLMLLAFLLFPRLGPLWSMPMPSDKRLSGLSEQMSPADIAELSQSSALAFRATFTGHVPPRAELYWRALTLEHFDGRQWSVVPAVLPTPTVEPRGTPIDYSVLLQPHAQHWLMVLDAAEPKGAGRLLANFSVQRRQRVEQAILYDMRAWPAARLDAERRPDARLLQLPATGDARARAFALELKRQYPNPAQLVNALMQHFSQAPFTYTLRPGVLGQDSIDSFLFDTQRGFCAHYAGAMTFVLRAAGIYARVVAGYQGGEPTDASTVQVRQFDAHAWVEYWQPHTGWIRVDPTFAVAPSRIEQGLEQAVADEQSFLQQSPFSPLRFRKVGWLNELRLSWDQLNHRWQRWVLGFDQTEQRRLWRNWFGQSSSYWPLVSLGALVMLVLALSAWLMLRRPKSIEPTLKAYQRFEALLAKHGIVRGQGEGPSHFAERAALQRPQACAAINAFNELFNRARYAGQNDHKALKVALKHVQQALAIAVRD